MLTVLSRWVAIALTFFWTLSLTTVSYVYTTATSKDEIQVVVRPFRFNAAALPYIWRPAPCAADHATTYGPSYLTLLGTGIRAAAYRNPNAPVRGSPQGSII